MATANPWGTTTTPVTGDATTSTERSKAEKFWQDLKIYTMGGGAATEFKSYGLPAITPQQLENATACMLRDAAMPLHNRDRSDSDSDDTDEESSDNEHDDFV